MHYGTDLNLVQKSVLGMVYTFLTDILFSRDPQYYLRRPCFNVVLKDNNKLA